MRLVRHRRKMTGIVCNNLVLYFAVLSVGYEYENFVHAAVLHFVSLLFGNGIARVRDYFARFGVDYIVSKAAAGKSVS